MMKKYDWIETDRAFFGKPNGLYDFEQHKPELISAKLPKLQEMKAKLCRAVNTRAVNLLGKEEEQVFYLNLVVLGLLRVKFKIKAFNFLLSSKNC